MTSKAHQLPNGITVRPLGEGEFEPFIRAVDSGFGNTTAPARLEQERRIFEDDRAFVAVDCGDFVGTTAAQSLPLTVPGGRPVPCGGIAYVTVRPTHRRRGIMTAMMRRQLDEIHARGEPLAALWASEAAIYGRFGFGMAVPREEWSIPRSRALLAEPDAGANGRVIYMSPDEARPNMEHAYGQARPIWAGTLERGSAWWDFLLADPEHERHGKTPKAHVVHLDGGAADGYAVYRVDPETRSLDIEELMWTTPYAHRALWQYCLSVDLIDRITSWNQPPDDPLPWMLQDSRRLRREPADGLWVRLVDVSAALSDRAYSSEGRFVLRVRDDFCPWNDGSFLLEAGGAGAQCGATRNEPDLELGAADLAAAYLGGVSFTTLHTARRVEEATPGALLRADRIFAGDRAPWCPEEF